MWSIKSSIKNIKCLLVINWNLILVLITCYYFGKYTYISNPVLYGSNSYVNAEYTILIKGILLLCGINWILFFMWIFPVVKIPIISSIGKNTLTIFLMHGFIKLYLGSKGGIFIYSRNVNMGLAAVISLVVILLFGNKYFGLLGKQVFTGQGIGQIIGYMKSGKVSRLNRFWTGCSQYAICVILCIEEQSLRDRKDTNLEIENRTKWHPAFCNIMELELMENAEGLTYDSEYNLSREPLKIDLLVIKNRHIL